MDNYLITIILLTFLTKTVLTDADLQQQNANQDQLNPLNDHEDADNTVKAQDKRTIFGSAASNYGWAKHVGYHPSGFKYVLGYTPVNLKYAPVVKPLSLKHQGYYYGRPKLHLHVRRPAVQIKPPRPLYGVPWKPTAVLKPLLPAPVAEAKPVHVDHVHTHVDQTLTVPHVDHVHKFPVHVDQVHPVAHPVAHPVPVHPIPQPVHVHPVPLQPLAPLPQPVVPLAPPQFIPSPLFEVTKPNLGVLPLGAVFQSPVLRHLPSPPVAVPFPLKPALVPQPVVPALPPPQPLVPVHPPPVVAQPHPVHVPQPALVPQPIAPQPVYPAGTAVEYHGTKNFINLAKGLVPVLPQTPVNGVHPHYYLQNVPARVPEQHDLQTHFLQQPQFHQQLPQEAQPHFQPVDQGNPHGILQQQLPLNQPTQFQSDQAIFQQQVPFNQQHQFHQEQDNQNVYQQQVPQDAAHYQPADQVSSQQFFHSSVDQQQGQFQPVDQNEGGYIYQQPELAQQIQPGQTDLQLPLHLPNHPGFVQNSRQFESGENLQEKSQFTENVFRPSIQLEPPYQK